MNEDLDPVFDQLSVDQRIPVLQYSAMQKKEGARRVGVTRGVFELDLRSGRRAQKLLS